MEGSTNVCPKESCRRARTMRSNDLMAKGVDRDTTNYLELLVSAQEGAACRGPLRGDQHDAMAFAGLPVGGGLNLNFAPNQMSQ